MKHQLLEFLCCPNCRHDLNLTGVHETHGEIESGKLEVGDPIIIIGPTTGAVETRVEELRVDEINCPVAEKGQKCSLPVKQVLRRSDKVYRLESRF